MDGITIIKKEDYNDKKQNETIMDNARVEILKNARKSRLEPEVALRLLGFAHNDYNEYLHRVYVLGRETPVTDILTELNLANDPQISEVIRDLGATMLSQDIYREDPQFNNRQFLGIAEVRYTLDGREEYLEPNIVEARLQEKGLRYISGLSLYSSDLFSDNDEVYDSLYY